MTNSDDRYPFHARFSPDEKVMIVELMKLKKWFSKNDLIRDAVKCIYIQHRQEILKKRGVKVNA